MRKANGGVLIEIKPKIQQSTLNLIIKINFTVVVISVDAAM